ncbi:MAG TPA: hypothetical protein VMY39_10780 [Planctomycetota bacterium]|nr:hypothetical protein [Planctomycetota bacterium]HUV40092.1 hypothetical protein [Planctomycetota bacterium]
MKGFLSIAVALFLFAGPAAAEDRFTFVDVYVDSGERPLAAYQFELVDETRAAKIVGIEGGDHAAFQRPPYYDKAAMKGDRVILADFSTAKDLPRGRTRVARVMVHLSGGATPRYRLTLTTAATAGGDRIPAAVSIQTEGDAR